MKSGITADQARAVNRFIKEHAPKSVSSSTLGEQVRVTAKKRDDLPNRDCGLERGRLRDPAPVRELQGLRRPAGRPRRRYLEGPLERRSHRAGCGPFLGAQPGDALVGRGWSLKSQLPNATRRPASGFTMKRPAISRALASVFVAMSSPVWTMREARGSPSPISPAPPRSASYSRLLDKASCSNVAARGARMTIAKRPRMLSSALRPRPPAQTSRRTGRSRPARGREKVIPIAIDAATEAVSNVAVADVADLVAKTPRNSDQVQIWRMP